MTSEVYWNQRCSTVLGQPPSIGAQAPVVIFGTSRTELMGWGSLGGRPVLNFGLSGIRCARAAWHAVNHLVGLSPWGVIIEMGINDAGFSASDPEGAQYYPNMCGIVQAAKSRTPRVTVMTVVPFEAGFPGLDAAAYVPRIGALSAANAQAAQVFGALVIDQNSRYRRSDLTAMTGWTVDGTHYSQIACAANKGDYDDAVMAMRWRWPD